MGTTKKRITRKGRLTKPERYLIALYKLDTETKEVKFVGLAFDARHAAQIITGTDWAYVDSVLAVMDGRHQCLKRYPEWFPVKMVVPYDQLLTPDDLFKMSYRGQALAEVKLAAIYTMKLNVAKRFKELEPEAEKFDALKVALAHIKSDIPKKFKKQVIKPETQLPIEEEEVVDPWSIYYDPAQETRPPAKEEEEEETEED